jgi:Rod binding domain-containing protein
MTEAEKVASLSRSFEAILLRSILENAQKPVLSDDPEANSTSAGIYRDIICNQLAEGISRSGALGLGREFERQLGTATQTGAELNGAPDAVAEKD